ncbi:MAG: 50S ribosomal protein L11 methyltransferase [Balneolaceae bacterium]
MSYIRITIHIPDHYQEMLIAELLDMDYYGFEQFDGRLEAYINKAHFNDVSREFLEQILSIHPVQPDFEIDEIEEKNWNQEWESRIEARKIGNFFLRPTWNNTEPPEGQLLIEIDPKMSFGTGYHETTRLMLKKLSELNLHHKTVLDAGTGTGILGIAAIKLGADYVFAFDIDPWSEKNATENSVINNVSGKMTIIEGGEEVIPGQKFDMALANINRNVLINMLPKLSDAVMEEGDILLSGILITDKSLMINRIEELGLKIIDINTEGDWILFHLQKRGN